MMRISRYDLTPSAEDVAEFKLPDGRRSNAEAENLALREKVKAAVNAFDEEDLTDTEMRLLAILQVVVHELL